MSKWRVSDIERADRAVVICKDEPNERAFMLPGNQYTLCGYLNTQDATIARLEGELAEALITIKYNLDTAECIHCGSRMPNEETDHWVRCEVHPAHKRLEQAEADLKRWQQIARVRNDRLAATEAELRAVRKDLEAKCNDNERLRLPLQKVHDLVDYREHAFGQPEVELSTYLTSLHDWLPEACAALEKEA